MTSRRLLTLSPDHERLWVRLYFHQIGGKWAAVIVDDSAPPPGPGVLKGLDSLGIRPEEVGRGAKANLGTRSR